MGRFPALKKDEKNMLSELEKAILDKYGYKYIRYLPTILKRLDLMVFLSYEEVNLTGIFRDLADDIDQATDENPL